MWAVIIYNRNHKHFERFYKKLGSYGALKYFLRVKKKFSHREDIQVAMVNITKAMPPPDDLKLKRKEWWCPYCRKPRVFKNNSYIGYKQCPVCGMGDGDFYVRQYNNLWKGAGKKSIRRRNPKEK